MEPLQEHFSASELVKRAERGDFDKIAVKGYRRLVEKWRLTNEDAAKLADMATRTWGRVKSDDWSGNLSQDQLLRLSALIGLYKGLHLYFADELADTWVTRENAGAPFRGSTPLRYMRDGGLPAILETRNYVDAIRGGV